MCQLKIESAKYEGGWLKLETKDYTAKQFIHNFKPATYEIKPYKEKRTLTANAYLWQLCTKIADEVRITKEEVYRSTVREGGVYVPMTLTSSGAVDMDRVWSKNGLGWTVELVDSNPDGTVLVFCYYGSSVYDKKQMSDLIDRVVQDAKNLGIETLTPYELSVLKDEWQ